MTTEEILEQWAKYVVTGYNVVQEGSYAFLVDWGEQEVWGTTVGKAELRQWAEENRFNVSKEDGMRLRVW